MRPVLLTCVLIAYSAQPLLAQPNIFRLLNNYSYIPPALPNYGIAQGSIFDVFGSGLAPTTTNLQSTPLQTALDGVTITVTVNGVTTHPPLYFLSPSQIDAVLPSSTPVGTGQITVTNGGLTSAPAPIQVVQSAVGIATLGYQSAAAFDVNWVPLDFTHAANPGDYITLWGSGLGPALGDETLPPIPVNLSNIPIEVDIGGVAAAVTYHGRSGYPGLDQINLIVPPGVSGCGVSVVVRTGDIVSNFATIPVAAAGPNCSDPLFYLPANVPRNFNGGSISLSKSVSTGLPLFLVGISAQPQPALGTTATSETAAASFIHYEGGLDYGLGGISVGSCFAYSYDSGGGYGIPPGGIPLGPSLNAGPTIQVSGPLGNGTMAPQQDGSYSGVLGGNVGVSAPLPAFIPDTGGTFAFDNGAGGSDVGAFKASVTLSPPLLWTNIATVSPVNRSAGLTLTWKGGQPNTYVTISGTSAGWNGTSFGTAVFTCLAPVEAQSFTVPQTVMLSLPASVSAVTINSTTVGQWSSLSISNGSVPQSFTAPGLDGGTIAFSFSVAQAVTFQ